MSVNDPLGSPPVSSWHSSGIKSDPPPPPPTPKLPEPLGGLPPTDPPPVPRFSAPEPPHHFHLPWLPALIGVGLLVLGFLGGYFFGKSQGGKENEVAKAASDDSWDKVKQAGTLVLGTTYELPWIAVNKETGKIEGAEAEFAAILGEKLGVKIQFTEKVFDDLIPELKAKKFDAIMAGISITDERKQEIDFADPYYTAGQQIIVKSANKTITGANALAGKKVGVNAGTTSETYVRGLGLTPAIDVRTYDEPGKYYTDLAAGVIDAVVYDNVSVSWYAKQNTGYKIVGEKLTQEGYGIGVRKADESLRAEINKAIAELKADSRYATIVKTWYE